MVIRDADTAAVERLITAYRQLDSFEQSLAKDQPRSPTYDDRVCEIKIADTLFRDKHIARQSSIVIDMLTAQQLLGPLRDLIRHRLAEYGLKIEQSVETGE